MSASIVWGFSGSCHVGREVPAVDARQQDVGQEQVHRPRGTRAAFLCLQCHEMHFHNARVAKSAPYTRHSGTRGSNCHDKVLGSDLP